MARSDVLYGHIFVWQPNLSHMRLLWAVRYIFMMVRIVEREAQQVATRQRLIHHTLYPAAMRVRGYGIYRSHGKNEVNS